MITAHTTISFDIKPYTLRPDSKPLTLSPSPKQTLAVGLAYRRFCCIPLQMHPAVTSQHVEQEQASGFRASRRTLVQSSKGLSLGL